MADRGSTSENATGMERLHSALVHANQGRRNWTEMTMGMGSRACLGARLTAVTILDFMWLESS
jgi:hypothetical protein